MILPLGHDGMTVRRIPWMTVLIIFANYIAFVATAHDESNFRLFGLIAATPTPWGYVTHMFIHADWMHLLGNMYFLYLVGCTVEDLWGRPLYVATYFFGGFAASALDMHFYADSHAAAIGASGAISAIMGVFFIRCFETELRCLWLHFPVVTTFKVRAGWILFLWFAEQLMLAVFMSHFYSTGFWAHIGGFLFGVAAASLLSVTGIERSLVAPALERKLNLASIHPRLESALARMDRRDYRSAAVDLKIVVRDCPQDPDLCQLLAQCYAFLGQSREARYWLHRELLIYLEQRNSPRIVDAYFELVRASRNVELTPKEAHVITSALRREGYAREASRVGT